MRLGTKSFLDIIKLRIKMELLRGTGIDKFIVGQGLSSAIMNQLNDAINMNAHALNVLLKSNINLNAEVGNYEKTFTFSEAINQVPVSRRIPGIKLRFIDTLTKSWAEYIFTGTDSSEWEDEDCWNYSSSNIIDGGEF